MIEIFSIDLEDGTGQRTLSVRLLQEFGQISTYLTPEKIKDLWTEYSKHDVLFTDHTKGKLEPFVQVLMSPRSIWLEIFDVDWNRPVGIMSLSGVIEGFDAKGHFAFWDQIAKGKEGLIWETMKFFFEKYDLHRISAEVPPYQSGTIRFIKRLGFQKEGELREAVIYKDRWFPLVLFGMTLDEFKEVYDG